MNPKSMPCLEAIQTAQANAAKAGVAFTIQNQDHIRLYFARNAPSGLHCPDEQPANRGGPTLNCPYDSNPQKMTCSNIESAYDAEAFASAYHRQGKTCAEAQEAMDKINSSRVTKNAVRSYYFYKDNTDATCTPPLGLLAGPLATSIIVAKPTLAFGGSVRIQHAFQLLPSFTIGIPFGLGGATNDARGVLNGSTAGAGVYLRYSPIALLLSLHGFVGTIGINGAKLDSTKYTSPAMLIEGVGVDVINGAIGFSYVWAQLKDSGLFGQVLSETGFFQLSFDLTAIAISLTGLNGAAKN